MAKQELTLTSKVRIYPKEEDKQKIIDTTNAFRNAANYVSKVVFNRKISSSGAAQDITYDTLREDFRLRADRKSTRLNSSHVAISYAVFCLKKKRHIATIKIMNTCIMR